MSDTRVCEFCAEEIPEDEAKCRHCGESRQQKTCSSCKETIPRNANRCRHCGEWDKGTERERYDNIPFLRRSGTNSAFVLGGLCCLPPLLWITCVMLLTGDVYYDERGDDGKLKTWSVANKVVAGVLLVLQVIGIAVNVARSF
jgi:RNA polymerase subunit RPABC4/transcription elongation factor Spt4